MGYLIATSIFIYLGSAKCIETWITSQALGRPEWAKQWSGRIVECGPVVKSWGCGVSPLLAV